MTVALQVRNLTYSYPGCQAVLERIEGSFESGEVVALTGPSGRGKSTLLYLLGLMLRPAEGQVLVDGSDTTNFGDAQRARMRAGQFGFVFQDAALDPSRTVLANVCETALYRGASPRAARRRALQLLEEFGVLVRPTQRPGQVSGGQAQRIALCRAMLHSPRIVLADEPTGNLDPPTAQLVMNAFRRQAALGATVVVASHDPASIDRCDRVVRL